MDRTIEILKKAVLLEKKGYAFYKKFSKDAKSESLKKFFELMAEEEQNHANVLTEQLQKYSKEKIFIKNNYVDKKDDNVNAVLTKNIIAEIAGADYEAAAISAAMSLEERAQKFYKECADSANDSSEKALYIWLSKWEASHLNLLVELDNALLEKVMFDNHFWPLD